MPAGTQTGVLVLELRKSRLIPSCCRCRQLLQRLLGHIILQENRPLFPRNVQVKKLKIENVF